MSTINSYFKARKNKSTPVYIGGKVNQPGIVVQSPEEKTLAHQLAATTRQIQQDKPKGILRFMSPIKQHEKKEEEEEEHIACKIKKPTKITDFWKDVVQNYHVDSTLDVKTGREKRSHGDDSERNVRVRLSSHETLQASMSDYYYDDDNEDLSRPLKRRFSLTETNEYLLEIVNELCMDDNSWCKLKPVLI